MTPVISRRPARLKTIFLARGMTSRFRAHTAERAHSRERVIARCASVKESRPDDKARLFSSKRVSFLSDVARGIAERVPPAFKTRRNLDVSNLNI